MDRQRITFADDLRQEQEFFGKAEAASSWLVEEVHPPTARAEWTFAIDDRERPIVGIHLYDDFQGEAHGAFAPEELDPQYEAHVRRRFRELEGAMLRVSEFRRNIGLLYENVEQWLGALQPRPYVRRDEVELRERASGAYKAPSLLFDVQGARMRLEPVAAWIVGADGRVDFIAPDGPTTILLDHGQWNWVIQRVVTRLEPVDRENFLAMVQEAVA